MYGKVGPLNPMFGIPRTIETKNKISAALKGKNAGELNPMYGTHWIRELHPNYGKIVSESTKEKISKANRGKKHSNEFKENQRQIRTGAKHTPQTLIKMSNAQKGENNAYAKLTEDNVRQIRKLLSLGKSQVEIAKLFKVNRTNIYYIRTGKTWKHVI